MAKDNTFAIISVEYLELLKELCLLDDDFWRVCIQDNEKAVELILRIALNDKMLKVIKVIVQKEMKNLIGHNLVLDVYAISGDGEVIDAEVQRDDGGAVAERAVYHSSTLDANSLKKGERDFRKKSETYTIFITENDVLGGGLPIYHIERCVLELGCNVPFGGKSHIIYINCSYKGDDDTDLCKLIHDFACKDPKKMYFPELSERVKYYKEDSEGMKKMGKIWEKIKNDGITEGIERGIQRGIEKGIEKTALSMLKDGLPHETIAHYTNLTLTRISELATKMVPAPSAPMA